MDCSSDGVLDEDTLRRLDEIDRQYWSALSTAPSHDTSTTPVFPPTRSDSMDSAVLLFLDRIDPPHPTGGTTASSLGHPPTSPTALRLGPQVSAPSSPRIERPEQGVKRTRSRSTSTTPSTSPLRRLTKRRHLRSPSSLRSPVRFQHLIDDIAHHSGSDTSAGDSSRDTDTDPQDAVEGDLISETQSPAASQYDQTAVYHQSLLTQAPALNIPTFVNRPQRPNERINTRERRVAQHQPSAVLPSWLTDSSPRSPDADCYELGSFVVDDDALSTASSTGGSV